MSDEEPQPPAEKLVERAHPLTPLIRGWIVLVALAWGFGRELLPDGSPDRWRDIGPWAAPWIAGIVGGVILMAIALGYLSWRFTRFVIDEEEVRVEKGFLFRSSERIRFDRVQAVDITQPIAARIFGLAELSIDAGAEGSTKLRYLTRRRAAVLRDYLLERAHGQLARLDEVGGRPPAGALDDLGADDLVLVRADPGRLLLGAVLSHEFLLWVVPFAVLAAVGFGLDNQFGATIRHNPWLLLGAAVPTVGAVVNFVVKRLIGQWNYTLAQTRAGLRISRGLFTLTSQSVPVSRIQSIRVAQPLLWRRLGLYRLDLEVLGFGELTHDEDQGGTSTILMPVGDLAQVRTALAAVWPGVELDGIRFTPPPARARWLNPLSFGWLGYGSDGNVVVTRVGWLTRSQSIIPFARLQSAAVRQGPWQRRLRLTDVALHTSGLLSDAVIKDTDAGAARLLLDRLANSAHRARMAPVTHTPAVAEPVAGEGSVG